MYEITVVLKRSIERQKTVLDPFAVSGCFRPTTVRQDDDASKAHRERSALFRHFFLAATSLAAVLAVSAEAFVGQPPAGNLRTLTIRQANRWQQLQAAHQQKTGGDAWHRVLTVDGQSREVFVFVPKAAIERAGQVRRFESQGAAPGDSLASGAASRFPVVFGFHGHGGHALNVASGFNFQANWPDAVVVYMQGLPTVGQLTDPEGKKTGWQHREGESNDRDLRFFDAVLKMLQDELPVDHERVFASGHSNGGTFTYVLTAARADIVCAVAPSACTAAPLRGAEGRPIPVMHIAGTQDPLVRYEWQELSLRLLKRRLEASGRPVTDPSVGDVYSSPLQTPLVTMIHPGTHRYPKEAPARIVEFFRRCRGGRYNTPD